MKKTFGVVINLPLQIDEFLEKEKELPNYKYLWNGYSLCLVIYRKFVKKYFLDFKFVR